MKTKVLSVMALSALLFASCNNDDNQELENDGRVSFTSGITSQTRVGGADGTNWEGDETIGIYMVKHGEALSDISILEGANNKRYATTSIGLSATFTSTSPIYYPVNLVSGEPQKVDFIAYHPYSSTAINSSFFYTINVSDQSDQSAIDLMTATANNSGVGYDKTYTSKVNLEFKHLMNKVIINVVAGNGVSNLNELKVKMYNVPYMGVYDLTGATSSVSTTDNTISITPFSSGSGTFEAILPIADLKSPFGITFYSYVEFSVGSGSNTNTYKWYMKDNTLPGGGSIISLTGGEKYTFNVTLNRNEVVASGTINAWTNGGTADGTAQ